MANFTQGPWAVTERAGYTGHGVSAGAKRICAINSNNSLPKDERDANAALLASAPDLLEALELLQVMDFRLGDEPHGREIRRRALKAIAAAKAGAR